MAKRLKSFEMPKKIIFDEETYDSNYGKVLAEPFEKGYGITIGNSIRSEIGRASCRERV